MGKKKDSKLELERYLNLVKELGGKVSKSEFIKHSFNYSILDRCAKDEGYLDFNDFKRKHNVCKTNRKKLFLDDIVKSYKCFYDKFNKFPTVEDTKENEELYSRVATREVLKEHNMKLIDLCNMISNNEDNNKYINFISLDVKKYEEYKNNYINLCKSLGEPIAVHKLTNYGLPTSKWFIKHCPNKEIKNYTDFYMWCGFKRVQDLTKDEVIEIIYDMQSKANRPLMYDDFRKPQKNEIGINIVKKHFETMNKMKEELGLEIIQENMVGRHTSLEQAKQDILNLCNYVFETENRKVIISSDVKKINGTLDFSTYRNYFNNNNENIRDYIESIGFELQKEGHGLTFNFKDGEKTKSKYELSFSKYLREKLGLNYNKNYFRDVRYNTFVEDYQELMDCDYIINYNGRNIYIEIAGILRDLHKYYYDNKPIDSKSKENYRLKLMKKEQMLKSIDCEYYILFPINKNYESVLDFDFIDGIFNIKN